VTVSIVSSGAAKSASASGASAKSGSHQRQLEAAAAAVKPPANVLPAAGKVLGGFSSQQMPVVFQIARKDKRINLAATALNMTCRSGDQFVAPDSWVKLPLTKKGVVNELVQIPPLTPTPGSTVVVTGGTDRITGKLNAKQATLSGTWELQLDFSMPGTNQTDQCDSGRVTFKAVL
jgi:hypothetical protein